MMTETIDDLYLTWLYSQVAPVTQKNPLKTYWLLFKLLYKKEFVWIVPNDDNRVEDGRDLRYEFSGDSDLDPDHNWMSLGCSFLEMLVALSRRCAFESDGDARYWFWTLLDNIQLRECNDSYCRSNDVYEDIDEVLDTVIWRTYNSNGFGGLFPLYNPTEDQREVELWYQLACYILERID